MEKFIKIQVLRIYHQMTTVTYKRNVGTIESCLNS